MRDAAFYLLAGFILYRLFILLAKKVNRRWWYRTFYLTSWHWKFTRWAKKLQVRIFTGKVQCEKCRSTKRLQVHHETYERIGRERLSDLTLLCDSCHKKEHRR